MKTVPNYRILGDIYTKVGFIFIGPNSLSRAEDLAAVNHVTQAVVRVGFKVGFKELRLEPKFLNRGPRAGYI